MMQSRLKTTVLNELERSAASLPNDTNHVLAALVVAVGRSLCVVPHHTHTYTNALECCCGIDARGADDAVAVHRAPAQWPGCASLARRL